MPSPKRDSRRSIVCERTLIGPDAPYKDDAGPWNYHGMEFSKNFRKKLTSKWYVGEGACLPRSDISIDIRLVVVFCVVACSNAKAVVEKMINSYKLREKYRIALKLDTKL